jgi:hypothetical protein
MGFTFSCEGFLFQFGRSLFCVFLIGRNDLR